MCVYIRPIIYELWLYLTTRFIVIRCSIEHYSTLYVFLSHEDSLVTYIPLIPLKIKRFDEYQTFIPLDAIFYYIQVMLNNLCFNIICCVLPAQLLACPEMVLSFLK